MNPEIERAMAAFSIGKISRLELFGIISVFVQLHPDQYENLVKALRDSDEEDFVFIANLIEEISAKKA